MIETQLRTAEEKPEPVHQHNGDKQKTGSSVSLDSLDGATRFPWLTIVLPALAGTHSNNGKQLFVCHADARGSVGTVNSRHICLRIAIREVADLEKS